MKINQNQPTANRPHVTTLEKRKTELHITRQNKNTYNWFNHEENNEEQEIKTPTTARELMYNLTKALEKWRDMSQEQRNTTKLHEFAELYHISFATFCINVNRNGLSQEGEKMLLEINNESKDNNTYELFNREESKINNESEDNKQEIKTPTNPLEMRLAITKALEKWQDMPNEQRKAIGLRKFAEQHGIEIRTFRTNANVNGLKQEGNERLLKIKYKHEFNKLTPQHIKEWQDICQNEQNPNFAKFTAERNLSTRNFIRHCAKSGRITQIGEQFIRKYDGHKFNLITPEILEEWSKLSQNERNEEWKNEFAERHNIRIITMINYINVLKEGPLRTEGKQLIQKAQGHRFNTIIKEPIKRWCSMTQTQRDNIGLHRFAEKNNLYYASFKNYVTPYGITTDLGQRKLNEPDKISKARTSSLMKFLRRR